MKPNQYKKKWYPDFQANVLNFVEQNGIINSFQIFDIYRQNYGNRLWEANILQRLYKIISQEPRLSQIDKTVPQNNGKNWIDLEGHQKIKKITFFVLSSLDEYEKLERSQNELNKLIEKSTSNPKPKKIRNVKNKISAKKTIELELKRSNSSTQLISYLSPGFISSKILRCQILHFFLNDTFGNNHFTTEDIFDKMPIDLYFKLIGSPNTPKILLQFPMLRFVLLKFFPQRILNAISFNESQKVLKSLLEKLEKEFYVIRNVNNNRYRLLNSLILSNSDVIIPIFFNLPNSIESFWQFIEITNRIENNDNESSTLWLKRWSLKDHIMKVKPENSMVYKFIQNVGYQSSNSIRQTENLVSKYGYESIFFNKFLPSESTEICEEDLMIHEFCMDFEWSNPKIKTNLPLKDQIYNDNYLDENYFLTDLVAKSRITIGSIIQKSNVKWQKILKRYDNSKILTWKDISNKFKFLFSNFINIQSRFSFTTASTIAHSFQNNEFNQTECFELNENKILSHFNIINQQLVTKNEIGEFTEAFKRFLLFPSKFYTFSQAESFFSEYIWSSSYDSQLLLKICGFYNQTDEIGNQKNKPSMMIQNDKSLIKGFYFYKEINNLLITLSQNGNDPFRQIPIVYNDISSTYYILHQDASINNSDSHIIDFVLQNEQNENEISIKAISSYSSYIYQLNKINKMFNLRFHCIPLPQIPSFSVKIEPLPENDKSEKKSKNPCDMKINQNLNFIFDAFHEFYLILSQINIFQNASLHLYACYSYGFIIHSEFDGLDLNSLMKIFNLSFNSSLFDELILSLEFLEQFRYIKKKQSTNALPIYIADAYFTHEEKEYFWTNICHQVDEQLLTKQCALVFEKIELNPGIEIFDLYTNISYLSISNLLDIINVLIYDDAIYMITLIPSNEDDLFEDTVFLPICNLSIDHILVLFYLSQIDPTCHLPIIQLYPTTHGALYNQCLQ